MADVGTSLRKFVTDQPSVSALIGSRMFPDELPQNATLPAVTYQRFATQHFDNIKGSKAGLANTLIQITVYAASRHAANEICEAIRLCGVLDLYGLVHGVNVRSIQVSSGRRDYTEPPIDGTHQLRYVSEQDYKLTYLEAV